MPDFDPRQMGSYAPPGSAPLHMAQSTIVDAFYYVKPADFDSSPPSANMLKGEEEKYSLMVYAGHLVPDDVSIKEVAWRFLRHELLTNALRSFVVEKSGRVSDIEASFWATDFAGIVLASGQMTNLDNSNPIGAVVVTMEDVSRLFSRYALYFITKFKEPFSYSDEDFKVIADDLSQHVSYEGEPVAKPAPVLRLTSGGRPSRYDGEEFLLHAITLMGDEVDSPVTQAELARRAIDAYERGNGAGGRPSMPWAKPRVRRLWAILRPDNNG